MKRKILTLLLSGVSVGTASAQFGFRGDCLRPHELRERLLRYAELQQQLVQLRTAMPTRYAYNLALQMSRNLQNMPARYEAQFSQWRNGSALTLTEIPGPGSPALTPASSHRQSRLSAGNDTAASVQPGPAFRNECRRTRSRPPQYATVELADGRTPPRSRLSVRFAATPRTFKRKSVTSNKILCPRPDLNTEVSVLNKINAAGVLTLRTLSGLEQTPGIPARRTNHPCQAAARGNREHNQRRYPAPSQHGRQI